MKNTTKLIISFLIILSQITVLKAQGDKKLEQQKITVYGYVYDINNKPLEGVSVFAKGLINAVHTNKFGLYRIEVLPNSTLEFFSNEYEPVFKYLAEYVDSIDKDNKSLEVNVSFEVISTSFTGISGAGSTSMKNYWIGAKVGYNFIGQTDDNFFVGSASIALNMFKGSNEKHSFAVIGNLGNFKFDKDTDSSEDIQKVVQSINGLSVGLGYTRQYNLSQPKDSLYFRPFVRTGVRMTTFDEIGEDMESVNLAQSATNAGLELEIGRFKNGGAISIATGITMYLFDENVYNQIFEEKKSSLFTLDTTVILPISKDLGFFINGTFTKRASAAYILGIIFRS